MPPEELKGKGAEFVKKYTLKYKSEPQGYAVYGYVAAKVALETLAKVGKKDRQALREATAQAGQNEGALGTWKFDGNGDTTLTTMSGNTVEAGKFKFSVILGAENTPGVAAAASGVAPPTPATPAK